LDKRQELVDGATRNIDNAAAMRRMAAGADMRGTRSRGTSHRIEFYLACLVVFFGPMNAMRFNFAYFTYSDAFSLLFYATMFLNRSFPAVRLGPAAIVWITGVALMTSFLLLSSAVNGDPTRGIIVSVQYMHAFLVLPIILMTRTKEELDILVVVLVASVLTTCLFGIYLIDFTDERNTRYVAGNGRMRSFVERSNEAAALIAATFPLLLYLGNIRKLPRILLFGCGVVFLYGIVLTASNSGLMSLVFAVSLYCAVMLQWRVLFAMGFSVLAIVALVVFEGGTWLPEVFRERVLQAMLTGEIEQAGSFDDRVLLIEEALVFANKTGLIGMGADQYITKSIYNQVVHNTYLLIWTEGGFVALIGLLMVLGAAVAGALSPLRTPGARMMAAVALSVTLTLIIFINSVPHIYGRFWVIPVALVLSLAGKYRPARGPSRRNRK
jgi:O-antigen ligase